MLAVYNAANDGGPRVRSVYQGEFTGQLAAIVARICMMTDLTPPDEIGIREAAGIIQDNYGYLSLHEIRVATDLGLARKLPGGPDSAYGRPLEWLFSVLSAYANFRVEALPDIARRLPPPEEVGHNESDIARMEAEFWEHCVKAQYARWEAGHDLNHAQLPEIFEELQTRQIVTLTPKEKRNIWEEAKKVTDADFLSALASLRSGRKPSEEATRRRAMSLACIEAFRRIKQAGIKL